MSHATKDRLLPLVESFFREHLQRMCGASPHTVRAYRDALRLLFSFVADSRKCSVADLTLTDLQVEAIKAFLVHLESKRANTAASRNYRLTAIRSFFRHLVRNDLSHAAQYQQVLALPSKKTRTLPASYLEPEDARLILNQPDCKTALGLRDHALMLFLYNTGARVSEALGVRNEDLSLGHPKQVRLHGKNRKDRFCPLWRETAEKLRCLPIVREARPGDIVFRNVRGNELTRDGVAYILRKYTALAARKAPALHRRNITPHVMRHGCAVALLQSGADVTVIRDYLGHASVATTSRYITTNLQMKRDALEMFWRRAGLTPARVTPWKPKPDLLAFLSSL
jgi:site-specific recombinase XerD